MAGAWPERLCVWTPGAAAPLAKVTGMIVTVRVRTSGRRGGAKHPRLGPRSGNLAGFKGFRGQFHEKIGASFYNPNRQNPAVSCLMFSRLSVWRERETPRHKWSLGQQPVLSAWKNMRLFPRAKLTHPKSPQNGGSNPFFRHTRLDLEQACMARSACRRVAAL